MIIHILDHLESFGGLKTHIGHLASVYPSLTMSTGVVNDTGAYIDNVLWINKDDIDGQMLLNFHLMKSLVDAIKMITFNRIELVHCHSYSGYVIGTQLSKVLQVPCVFTLHGIWAHYTSSTYALSCVECGKMDRKVLCTECTSYSKEEILENRYNYLMKSMYLNNADYIFVLNRATYNICHSFFKINKSKLLFTYHWINILPVDKIEQTRRMHQREGGKSVILWAGTNLKLKKLDIALRAFEMLYRQNDGYELWLAGISENDLSEYDCTIEGVKALGSLSESEMNWAYACSDILWHTSISESVSYVILEAMAQMVPCIAVEGLDNSDFLFDGYNVLLVPKSNCEAFVQATERLHAENELRDRIVCNARDYVCQNHSRDKCVDQMLSNYKRIISSF